MIEVTECCLMLVILPILRHISKLAASCLHCHKAASGFITCLGCYREGKFGTLVPDKAFGNQAANC
jgi:hypothetical protein